MTATPCPGCGASGEGFVCAYCGAALHEPGDARAELAALEQYHEHVAAAVGKTDQCARMISHGYIPTSAKALIEAGLRCLPHLDGNDPQKGCEDQWAARLSAVTTRLKISHPGETTRAAVAEFEAKTAAWNAKQKHDTIAGCSMFTVLGLGLIAAAWWLLKRLLLALVLSGAVAPVLPSSAQAPESAAKPSAVRLRTTARTEKHIRERHFPGGRQTRGKSIFFLNMDLKALLAAAENASWTVQANGRHKRVVDAGKPIGTAHRSGRPMRTYVVISEPDGLVITAYPGD